MHHPGTARYQLAKTRALNINPTTRVDVGRLKKLVAVTFAKILLPFIAGTDIEMQLGVARKNFEKKIQSFANLLATAEE